MTAPHLIVNDLSVSIGGRELLHGLSFELEPGGRLGLIGGSGSGKTLTALAIAGLLPENARVSGSIRVRLSGEPGDESDGGSGGGPDGGSDGEHELVGLPDRDFAALRGDLIGMVFQEPKTALNPLRRLGRQMTESLALHYALTRRQRREAALRLAARVGLSDPERMVRAYPHEVSGGQRQRAAIAAAISANPGLLLADEPTTALDVTVQRGVLRLFRELTETDASSLLFITHNLAVMAEVVDRVLVLDAGRIVEQGAVADILTAPAHPVTRQLIDAAASEAGLAPPGREARDERDEREAREAREAREGRETREEHG